MSFSVERYDDVTRLRMRSLASGAVGLGVSAYVVGGVMIDSGFPHAWAELERAVRELGVRGVAITHWHEDHAGNVPGLAARGLPFLLRADTEGILRTPAALPLYRRIVWGTPPTLAGTITRFEDARFSPIPTPGHTADHQVIWDAGTATIFSGDLWLGVRARTLHATENPYRILESIRTVAALQPRRMFDAHRGLVPNPPAALAAKAAWLAETLGTVERAVERGWSDRRIVRQVLGGEDIVGWISSGNYARINFVRAVRRVAATGE